MNKGKIILKLCYLGGYLLFAGFSAYFTASSLSLNLLNGTNLWLVYALVFVVAVLAGWCLTIAIEELKKRVGASKATFIFSLIGFIIFWMLSFITNVHYFFVEKHGYSILTKELTGAKNYITENTSRSNKAIDEQKDAAKMALSNAVAAQIINFQKEIDNTIANHKGFGAACVNILNSIEVTLAKDSDVYGDTIKYVVFDDERDRGDVGITQRNLLPGLQNKYISVIDGHLQRKLAIIDQYYENKKDQNIDLIELLDPIHELETKHLPAVLKDGSVDAFYRYLGQQDGMVISKMPEAFAAKTMVKSGDDIKSFNIYPSKRMFDTVSVWGDILSGRLAGFSMLQWIIIALIFDIVSFILFALFRKS